jgi:flagellar biosynthetic protein FliO
MAQLSGRLKPNGLRPMIRPVSCGGPRLPGRFTVLLAGVSAGLLVAPANALAFKRDNTLLPAAVRSPSHASATTHIASGAGNAALHMLLGLAVVSALIFGLYKILKRTAGKNDKTIRDDGWMQVVSSTPLGPSRSLHLVRVGNEVVLLASSEQSVTPVRVYGTEEAELLGAHALPAPVVSGRRSSGNPSFGSSLIESLKRLTAR